MADATLPGNFELAKKQAAAAVGATVEVDTVRVEDLDTTLRYMHPKNPADNRWAKETVDKRIPLDEENYHVSVISTNHVVQALLVNYGANGYTMYVRGGKDAPVFAATDSGLRIIPRGMSKSADIELEPKKTLFVQADNGMEFDLSCKVDAKRPLCMQLNYDQLADAVYTAPSITWGPNTAGVDVAVKSGANITLPASLAQTAQNGYVDREENRNDVNFGGGNRIAFIPSQQSYGGGEEENYSVHAYIRQPDGKAAQLPLYVSGEPQQDNFQQAITDAAQAPAASLKR